MMPRKKKDDVWVRKQREDLVTELIREARVNGRVADDPSGTWCFHSLRRQFVLFDKSGVNRG